MVVCEVAVVLPYAIRELAGRFVCQVIVTLFTLGVATIAEITNGVGVGVGVAVGRGVGVLVGVGVGVVVGVAVGVGVGVLVGVADGVGEPVPQGEVGVTPGKKDNHCGSVHKLII